MTKEEAMAQEITVLIYNMLSKAEYQREAAHVLRPYIQQEVAKKLAEWNK